MTSVKKKYVFIIGVLLIVIIGVLMDNGVIKNPFKRIKATDIILSKYDVELGINDEETIDVLFQPANATDQDIKWASKNPEVVEIVDGKIVAKTSGSTEIVVTGEDNITKVIKVTVFAIPVRAISLSKKSTTINVGDSFNITPIIEPADASDKRLTWKSSDPSIATIDADGTVRAVSNGTVTITATASNGESVTCTINVAKNAVEVENITLDQTSAVGDVGETLKLTASITPSNATNKNVVWTSSNEKVATVNENGIVTLLSKGKVKITAIASNAAKVECEVVAMEKEISPTGIVINQAATTINIGDAIDLKATITPENATNKSIAWTSSNTSVATVSNGKVIGHSAGSVIITAKTTNNKEAILNLTVVARSVPVTSISLSRTTATIVPGLSIQLMAVVNPSNATNRNIMWSSSNTRVAAVDGNGNIHGISPGTAIITAIASNGAMATCKITVENRVIRATDITIDKSGVYIIAGQTLQLNATVFPSDATDKTVIWSSADTTIATVNQTTGLVTGRRNGTTTIYAETSNGLKAASKITVRVEVDSVILNKTNETIKVGDVLQLSAEVNPSNATDRAIIWESLDSSIATVNREGVVIGKKAGTTTIVARSANGKTASCTITVIVEPTSIVLNQTNVTLNVGSKLQLVGFINPSDATDKTIIWGSTDQSIATVDNNGLVTGKMPGTTIITARTSNGRVVSCTVKVVLEATSISLNKTSVSLRIGETLQLTPIFTPGGTTERAVTWGTNNFNVASVSSTGLVTARKSGTATITVRTNNGKTATCTITVVVEASAISINKQTASIRVGENLQLSAVILPNDTTDKTITWTTSDSTIASVSSTGLVTGKKAGTATIIARTSNGRTASCKVTVAVEAIGISLNRTTANIRVGEVITLTPTITPSDTTDKTVTWSVSNATVATVNSSGQVTGKKPGTVTVTARTSNGKTATCTVTVVIEATGISLNKTTETIKIGSTSQLTATVLPSNATNKAVTWSSSDANVASVSSTGVVTARQVGTVIITARTNNGKTATCIVTVIVEVSGVSLNKTTETINVGSTSQLTATITPSNATNKSVTWTTSDSSVATVSNGLVTAKKAGTATITVKTNNGKTATCTVTVVVPVTGVSLNKTSETLKVGATIQLSANISPSNATNKSVTWTSSDTSIATVNTSGLVTAKKAGTATITVKTNNGKTATCTITVIVESTSISLNRSSETIKVGGTIQLTATISPSNATNKSVTWTTSDSSIATVSNGLVTGKKAGTVTITAKTNNGKTATCTVTVIVEVSSISLNKASDTIKVGGTTQLTATISPSNATNKSVTWTSSDSTIAVVTNGLVTGKKAGTVTITAKTNNGKTATCTVTVIVEATGVSINKSSASVYEGETVQLSATISPSNVTNKTITWTSSDTSVATVSTSGLVTTKKAGTATITAKTNNGKTASCLVTVKAAVANIYFLKTGDADSIILESNGHYGLIDAAETGNEAKAYLNKLDVKTLDFVIATHGDGDHCGGIPTVASSFVNKNTTYYYRPSSIPGEYVNYRNAAYNAMKQKGAVLYDVTGKYPTITLGDFKIELMNTEVGSADEKDSDGVIVNDNKNSIVAYVTYKGKYGTLLTGDLESQDEYRMVSKLSGKSVEVLKVPHHSWQSSMTMKFTKAIFPKVAVVTSTYLLDDISTPVYYMQQTYGTKFYLTQKSDDAIVINYGSSCAVKTTKALVENYKIVATSNNWRKLQNGIWFYLKDGTLKSVAYDEWIKNTNNDWYYVGLQGNMMTGWIETKYNGKAEMFYLDQDGKMLTGWQQAKSYGPYNNDKSYYYKSYIYSHENHLVKGWYQYTDYWANGRHWFYFDPTTGVMYYNKSALINGQYYEFDGDGICTSSNC